MIWPVMHALGASGGGSSESYPLELVLDDVNTSTVSGYYYVGTTHRPEEEVTITARMVIEAGDWSSFKQLSVNGVNFLDNPEAAHDLQAAPWIYEYEVYYELKEGEFVSHRLHFENKAGQTQVLNTNSEASLFVTHYEAYHPPRTVTAPNNGNVSQSSGGYQLYFSREIENDVTVIVRFSPTEGDVNDLDLLTVGGVDIHANPDEDFEILIPAGSSYVYVEFDRSRITTEGSVLEYSIYLANKPGEEAVFGDEGIYTTIRHQVPEVYEINISPPWSTNFNWSGGEYSLNFNQPIANDGTITGRLEILSGNVDFAMANYNTIHPGGPLDIPLTAGTDRISVQLNGAFPSQYRLHFENKSGERKILPAAGFSFTITHA